MENRRCPCPAGVLPLCFKGEAINTQRFLLCGKFRKLPAEFLSLVPRDTVDGKLRAFKPGTALLIRHTAAPAVPVAIIGAHEIWGRDKDRPLRGKVTVVFGRPIDFAAQFTDDAAADQARITEVLQQQGAALIDAHAIRPDPGFVPKTPAERTELEELGPKSDFDVPV